MYDSATLKKSVKDKISIFHATAEKDTAGRPQSLKEEKHTCPPPVAEKSSSLPRDVNPSSLYRSSSQLKDVTDAKSPEKLQGGSQCFFVEAFNSFNSYHKELPEHLLASSSSDT